MYAVHQTNLVDRLRPSYRLKAYLRLEFREMRLPLLVFETALYNSSQLKVLSEKRGPYRRGPYRLCLLNLFSGRGFVQFALQGAAVHVECASGGGNIIVLFVQHTLYMFPFQMFDLGAL